MGELSIPRHEWGLKGPSYCKDTMGNLFFLRGFNRKSMAKVEKKNHYKFVVKRIITNLW